MTCTAAPAGFGPPPPRLGKHFPLAPDYQLRGRTGAAILTMETLLDTPYPQRSSGP
ncbi:MULTISPECIES: hypothetical protein [unclassified Aeromonas]|uniref:hypothetical protein n=1 Tax=unclassified Aeromonas TaxID=257493 RepID=UPI0022E359E7|nr:MULTISPECIES: hypothetical protein [unclassified Aeromonas]